MRCSRLGIFPEKKRGQNFTRLHRHSLPPLQSRVIFACYFIACLFFTRLLLHNDLDIICYRDCSIECGELVHTYTVSIHIIQHFR